MVDCLDEYDSWYWYDASLFITEIHRLGGRVGASGWE